MTRKIKQMSTTLMWLVLALFAFTACERDDDTKGETQPTLPRPKDNANQPSSPSLFNKEQRVPPKRLANHWQAIKPGKVIKTGFDTNFVSRLGRRVSIRKIENSVKKLTGFTWRDNKGKDLFAANALTLGRADYLQLNNNSDEVTKLFMKLMNDMATNVCQQVIDADLKKSAVKDRKFVRDPKDVDNTLRFIRLKYHAISVPASATDGIKHYRNLYNGVLALKKDAKLAWNVVCIATLTAPEFLVY